jgi:hypothetical protein
MAKNTRTATRRPSRHTAATMERKYESTAPTRHPASAQTDLAAWATSVRNAS